jgi:hypothetical protein
VSTKITSYISVKLNIFHCWTSKDVSSCVLSCIKCVFLFHERHVLPQYYIYRYIHTHTHTHTHTYRWCYWIFLWHIFFRPYHGPGVDSAPSENEYQEYFLGVKAAGEWGWRPHHLHVPNVMKIWEPKPPGNLWATPGLLRDSFTFLLYIYIWFDSP